MIRFFILSIFFANPAFSQDQVLAQEVVSKCEILSELAASGKVYSDSNELYSKLQEFDSSGKLLIESCESDILEFVSNYCSSQSTQNQDICSRVGISYRDDYKSFGVEALPSFATGYSRLPEVSSSYEFRAAGFLFLISPVRKLKIASGVSKVLRLKARPVLSGAILVLSSLGLASCDDLPTEPEDFASMDLLSCIGNIPGYFELQGTDINSCIKIPKATFSFTSYGGRESEIPNGDPRTTIKIKFDTEISYISKDGTIEHLTKKNVLRMLKIVLLDDFDLNFVDLAYEGGLIDVDQIEIDNLGGKTTITIKTPNGGAYKHEVSFIGRSFDLYKYELGIKNFIPKTDMSRFESTNMSSINSYLEVCIRILEYEDDYYGFFIYSHPSTCDIQQYIEQSPSPLANKTTNHFCETDHPTHGSSNVLHFKEKILKKKADPNKVYDIDIAFIVSKNTISKGLTPEFFREFISPSLNGIFQNSGVNVKFNVVAVEPYHKYKKYLSCSIDSIDGLDIDLAGFFLQELTPKFQAEFGADLLYMIHDYSPDNYGACGKAFSIRDNSFSHSLVQFASRWVSSASLDFNCGGYFKDYNNKLANFIKTLAHEMGHNLGLWHNGAFSKNSQNIFTPTGYGYVGRSKSLRLQYGTIMSSWMVYRTIPLFSQNRSFHISEVCADPQRFDIALNYGFCSGYRKVSDTIKLGGMVDSNLVDASEALKYTIEDASNYAQPPTN